jgi:hypothetical protein
MFAMGMTRNRQTDKDRKVHDAAVRRAAARREVSIHQTNKQLCNFIHLMKIFKVREILKQEQAEGTSEEEILEDIKLGLTYFSKFFMIDKWKKA